MSTATSRPMGDNEFPVLLRLPDLNAPVWAPPAPASGPAQARGAGMAAAATTAASTTTLAAAAPSSPVTTTVAAAEQVDTRLQQATTETIATGSVTEPVEAAGTRRDRLPRLEIPAFSQWSLVRQLTTGGVLVAGLLVTLVLIISSGDSETPDQIQAAQQTIEPPVIDIPTDIAAGPSGDGPVVLKPETGENGEAITSVPSPPRFNSWEPPPRGPSHIQVAETPPADAPRFQPNDLGAPPGMPNDGVRYEGRIGPSPELAADAPRYPTTDPSTFEFRPEPSLESGRTDTARLNGTIAPPPLR